MGHDVRNALRETRSARRTQGAALHETLRAGRGPRGAVPLGEMGPQGATARGRAGFLVVIEAATVGEQAPSFRVGPIRTGR